MTTTAMEILKQDAYARFLGIETVETGDGTALLQMPIRPCLLNSGGRVHGGAIMSLADMAFATAAVTRGEYGSGISVHVNYMKGATSGTLWARAVELSRGRTIGHYQVSVEDDDQNLIASFQGTLSIMPNPNKLLKNLP